MAKTQGKTRPSPLLAILLAWLVPGAGHLYIGRTVRGIIIFVTITATFWAGIAMGGVMTVDRQNEGWWFVADMLTGVNGLVGWRLQSRVYDRITGDPDVDWRPPGGYDPAAWRVTQIDKKLAKEGLALVAPTETIARAYAGVAGMLNLMCIFDACILAVMGVTGEGKLSTQERRPSGQEK